MNFVSIDYFLATESERSFTRAAEKLHITQQTLSSNISNLEKELGSTLFVRHVPLELTYAGEVFLEYARHFRESYEMMTQEFSDIRAGKQGELKVGVGYTRGRTIMPALIDLFQREHPHYYVRMFEGSNAQLREQLVDGYIDLAIGKFPEVNPGLDVYPFYSEEIVLIISKEILEKVYGNLDVVEQLRAGEYSVLQKCPFVIGRPEDVSGAMSRNLFKEYNIKPEVKAISDNVETLLALCVRGVGACLCPRNLMEMTLSKSRIRDLYIFELPENYQYQIRFGVKHKDYQWSPIREFMRIAMESELFGNREVEHLQET